MQALTCLASIEKGNFVMNSKKELERIEKISSGYRSESLEGANELYHISVLDSLIPEKGGRSVLEIGCGKGLWTKVLCERYDSVDVVDGSNELLEKVMKENSGCRAELKAHGALVEDFIAAAGQTWQHIYMTFILEHLLDPVVVLKGIKSCMEIGGCLFIAVPNAASLHRIIALRMGMIESITRLSESDTLVGHRRVYTAQLLRAQVLEAGLNIVEERGIGLKPLSLGQMEDCPPELANAFCRSGDLTPGNAAYLTMKAAC